MLPLTPIQSLPQTCTALALCAALGCGSAKPLPRTPGEDPRPAATAAEEPTGDGLGFHLVSVPPGTLGPYIGYGSKGALALYAPPAQEQDDERRWFVQPIDPQGKPVGSPLDIGPAPEDAPFAVVRETSDGFLALWVRQVHRADVLEGALLDKEGTLIGEISIMTQARGEVVWADAFPTSKGMVVLWAEQAGDRAKLKSIVVDKSGAPQGNGEVMAQDMRAWEAVGLDDGVAVALVVAGQDPMLGAVVLLRMDAEGKAQGEPVAVSKGTAAQLDVGMVRTGRSLLLAWTDRSNADSLVHAAATDLKGRVMVAPRAPLPPQGEQALVALVQPSPQNPNQALLVYEELPARSKGPRELHLATLSAEAVASERTTTLSFEPVGPPIADFSEANDGFILLTRAPVCDKEGACGQESVPWYLRINADLSIVGAAPLLVDALDREPPAVVWSPGCTSAACFTLAAGAQDTVEVVTARLPKGSVAPGVPARREPPPTAPRPVSNRAIHVSADPLSDIDMTESGDMTYVGWVTHFVEGLGGPSRPAPAGAPGDPSKPMAAQVAVQRLDASGQRVDEPSLLSVRAMSAGGVALAPNKRGDEVCAAWAAHDNGHPQLFLTRVGSDGKTKLQRMITRAKGDVADVALTPHEDGWVVAWVDWRDGNGEVYATRVNSMLVRLTPEKRLTNAQGDASDVTLAVVGDELLVAYGDSRDHPTHAMANPYVQKLRLSNLERIGEERRISTSDLHAKGVQLSLAGEELVVGWVAQAPAQATDKSGAGARISRLDTGSLRPLGETSDLHAANSGTPVALRLACEPDVCRGAMMVPSPGGMALEGFSWFPRTGRVQRGQLARVSGPSAADVAPAGIGAQVFFVDQNAEGENRLRRVHVKWIE